MPGVLPRRICRSTRRVPVRPGRSNGTLSGLGAGRHHSTWTWVTRMVRRTLQIRGNLEQSYGDVLTTDVLSSLEALAAFDGDRRTLMASRIARRAARAAQGQ